MSKSKWQLAQNLSTPKATRYVQKKNESCLQNHRRTIRLNPQILGNRHQLPRSRGDHLAGRSQMAAGTYSDWQIARFCLDGGCVQKDLVDYL